MRGVDVTLVEKGNLTHGTTGRMHGLLHSGGRPVGEVSLLDERNVDPAHR